MIYQEIREKLTGSRTSKKLGNNTYAHIRDGETIAIRLHETDILTFKVNGDIVLNSGGWRTVTTKARLNEYLPHEFYINQTKGVWYVMKRMNHEPVGRFEEGLTIKSDGTIQGMLPLIPKMESIDRNFKKKIKTYCTKFIEALEEGKVQPSNGDCWFCLMRETKTGKPLGEMSKNNHIEEHIKENYFVLSLLQRAFELMPVSIAMKQYVACSIDRKGGNVFAVDFVKDQVVKVLYRYICRQYGYAS